MTTRLSPRAMLVLVASADLPTPTGVSFINDHLLTLDFGCVADGQAWSRHLGGSTNTYVDDGYVYLSEGAIRWRGWSVGLYATDPVPGGSVAPESDMDTATWLAVAVGGEVVW